MVRRVIHSPKTLHITLPNGVPMRKIRYTHTITRTIEIEVECVIYPDYGEAEVLKATDCETGNPIELEDHEEEECVNDGAAEHMQGMKDDEADRRYEDRKLGDD